MFEELTNDELYGNNGGALAGGIAGAILGGTAGLCVGVAAGCANGSVSGNTLWKCYVTGALVGGAIGAATPI